MTVFLTAGISIAIVVFRRGDADWWIVLPAMMGAIAVLAGLGISSFRSMTTANTYGAELERAKMNAELWSDVVAQFDQKKIRPLSNRGHS